MSTVSTKALFDSLEKSPTSVDVKQEIYRRFALHVIGVVARFFKDKEDVKDVTQETFYNIFRAKQFQGIKNHKGWISQIAANTSIAYIKKYKKSNLSDFLQFSHEEFVDFEFELTLLNIEEEKKEKIEWIKNAIKRLRNPQQAECFTMHYFNNLSYREIADILNVEEKQVKSHIQNARKSIRKQLS